jgi:hypothetical protein
VEVSEIVVKRLDAQGRVSLPIEWRREWKSNKVVLTKRGSTIEVGPIEPLDPSDLFDSIEVPGHIDLSDPHTLRKGLMELRGNDSR